MSKSEIKAVYYFRLGRDESAPERQGAAVQHDWTEQVAEKFRPRVSEFVEDNTQALRLFRLKTRKACPRA